MKKTLSVLLALVITICVLTTTVMVASAAETDTQSGIEATLVTDKDAYSSSEDIKVTVNVKNTNTYDVNDVSITVELPEGLTLKSGDLSISDIDIAAGETYSKEVVAVKETSTPPTDNPTDTPTDKPTDKPAYTPTDKPSKGNPSTGNNSNKNTNSPQTGDSSNIVLWVALMAISAAGIFFTVKFRKKATKFLSLLLCMVMVCAIVPTSAFAAEGDTDTVNITLDKMITVDGSELTIKAMVGTALPDGGYHIDILSSYGGTVKGVSGNYKANSKIDIEATPDDGWIFVNWESTNGGEFEDNKSNKTTFTTPNNSTTVVARFIHEEQSEMNADELDVYLAYNALEIGYSLGDYSDLVTNKLSLPISYGENEHTVNISWTSTDLNIVSATGDVNRPDGNDEKVSVIATLTKGEVSHTKQFDIKVIKASEIIVSDIHDNTEDDLIALNENAEYDLELEYNDDETQVKFISGKYSEVKVNSIDTAISSIYSVKSLIGLTDPASELSFSAVNHDEYTCAYSFGQIYNGTPVYGRTVTVNADNDSGEARAISSNVLPNSVLSSISLTPSVSIENLSNNYVINSYELVIYSLDDYEESPVLAYVLHSDGEIIIVNAGNADVLLQFQTSNDWGDYSTTGSGKTELGDTVTFPVQFHQWDWWFFYLEDVQRKIYVHGDKAGAIEHEFNTEWGDKTANSAYTNVITVYDWYKSHLNRNSIDNNGMAINVNVHNFKNEKNSNGSKITDNAHWDGSNNEMCFFENSNGGIPTTAAGLDVIAHEMTHGVFQYSINQRTDADFPYSGYTGSINEGYADVFGYFVDNDDWTMGENWETLRSLSDPELMGAPSKMSSPNYYTGTNQSVLVHTNSSIVYHAAYLMYSYGIRGSRLEKLWYNSMSQGYDATADFKTVRRNLIQSAKNLHFSNEELDKVHKAFDTEEVFDGVGTLSGKICKASDRSTAISGATINVYKNNNLYTTQTADATGNYSIDLPAGQYYIEITAEGYIDFHSYATVTEGENTYMETFLMVEGSEDKTGVASGRVVNSLTGTGVDSVTLTVRKDWNNLNESAETVATTTTGSNGNYSMELPLGNYTVVASKDGYITSSFNIIVQSGKTDNQNGTIVPVVSGDEFLITLTWGENPCDLDSHVEGKLTNGDPFHVYYEHKSQYDGNVEVCNLDYDDVDSYGPEHITLKVTTDEPYYYYIYKYAGNGTVAASSAKITVHQGNSLIAEYNVPTNLGGDDYWNVFAIKDGQLIDKNTITSSADTHYAD